MVAVLAGARPAWDIGGGEMAQPAKRKVSLTLDADLVAEVEAEGGNLSAAVNEVLRDELARVPGPAG
jgi:uncharacterized protein (DUF4415 family)